MSESENLRRKFLEYAKSLETTRPSMAKKIRKRVDKLVAWHVKNRRDMTLEEFRKIMKS